MITIATILLLSLTQACIRAHPGFYCQDYGNTSKTGIYELQ